MNKIYINDDLLMYTPLDHEDIENEVSSITSKLLGIGLSCELSIVSLITEQGSEWLACSVYTDENNFAVVNAPMLPTMYCKGKAELFQAVGHCVRFFVLNTSEDQKEGKSLILTKHGDIKNVYYAQTTNYSSLSAQILSMLMGDRVKPNVVGVDYMEDYIMLTAFMDRDGNEVVSVDTAIGGRLINDGTPAQAMHAISGTIRYMVDGMEWRAANQDEN